MGIVLLAMVTVLLLGCDRPPEDTVESLMANPQRRAELQSLCKAKRQDVSRALCRRVAEVRKRKRFDEIKFQESQAHR